ncbi:DUF5686 and carboxypeptidase regulatory-like domain-containing protein [Mucilaginibacter sp. L3T2-6]|uniref:DUF5686 and carboxypeptidase regulatory-like domain-containing protein n=1 Tax=Mucilaginibacter sp. L3T2-6 TaxID=3062491 RepID=UPI002674ABE3|nr:DUF5686 and carboxypeptidase regulatory-like domain-containing protein [Mucilaginibacter sp. L3T2-6]MDO3644858.1 DUF5686 and carboxypeptidase regulatory-like domain-containing protein [Mucilaginibacter sp. L3T2-6]MDV6217248.1 DUF5686 and carboxypeptidase regulatory-like domain-containing protein [Mucilaginibacter sp. L3T2-6]
MKFTLPFILFIAASFSAFSQTVTISGKITDQQNKPVPFASVYIKNTTKGTSANSEGEYTLQLTPGAYDIQYKAVGYRQQSHVVELNKNTTADIVLQMEAYQLNDVTVKSGGEDPAYAIIRKAIKNRKKHLNEVDAYNCEVYIKGLQKLLAAPKKFLGFDVQKATREIGLDSNRRGIVYLSESESKFSFMRPDKTHEELISSKVSGSNQAFSFNRASDIRVNFYENIQTWNGLSLRPLVSPIADNALFYYNYRYIGFTTENGETVNKIKVTPKRGYDACFQGYIYILEDSWRIYSLDLFITKKQNINFVDTLKLKEQFFPVNKEVWMPSSVRFDFTAGLLSFKVGGYFIAVYKDYDINPKTSKKDFAEVLRITKGSNKKDSIYWANERPVPLTDEEKTDYEKKAVLARKRESKPYLDSLDKENNKFSLLKLTYDSYHHRNRYDHEYYNLDAIIPSIRFNTVQGFNLNYGASFSKLTDSSANRYFTAGARAGYGFSDKKFTGAIYLAVPAGPYNLGFNAGSEIADLNNHAPVSPLVNTLYSLFERQNFEKLYQKQYVSFSAGRRITGGWLANAYVEWADRTALTNSSGYSFFKPGNHDFTSNNPYLPGQDIPLFAQNQSLKVSVRTSYDFSNRYETYPTGRRYLPSKYPAIGLTYTKGIKNIFGSDVNYDLVTADISKSNISAGVLGQTSFFIGAGKFLNNNSLFYPDFKQFSGNQVLFAQTGINSFLLLNYYTYSTNTEYLEGHFEQNFSGFILNKIPLIRKLKLQEILDVNYLSTPALKNYTELGIGVQYLGFRLMYGKSFNSGSNTNSAVRIGLNF